MEADFEKCVRSSAGDLALGGFEIEFHQLATGESCRVVDLGVCGSTAGRIYNLHCGFKPIATTAALAALESIDVGVGPHSYLADLLPGELEVDPTTTLEDLLGHRLDLEEPTALQLLGSSDAGREVALSAVLSAPLRSASRDCYSDVGMLTVLDAILRHNTNTDLVAAVDQLAAKSGLDDLFARHARVDPGLIGCLVERLPLPDARGEARFLPFLQDRFADYHDSPFQPMIGGYASMADLATFYAHTTRALQGESLPGFPSPELVRGFLADPKGSFSMGYWVDLRSHGLPGPGPAAFAHHGLLATTLGLADPDRELVLVGTIRALSFGDDCTATKLAWQRIVAWLFT